MPLHIGFMLSSRYFCFLVLLVFLLSTAPNLLWAQSYRLDSLRSLVESPAFTRLPDSAKSEVLYHLGYEYSNWSLYEKSLPVLKSALAYADSSGSVLHRIRAMYALGTDYAFTSDFERGLRLQLQALEITVRNKENKKILHTEAVIQYSNIALTYMQARQFNKAVEYFHKSINTFAALDSAGQATLNSRFSSTNSLAHLFLGLLYGYRSQPDSALVHLCRAEDIIRVSPFKRQDKEYSDLYRFSFTAMVFAMNKRLAKNTDSVLHYAALAEPFAKSIAEPFALTILYRAVGIAEVQRGKFLQAEAALRKSCSNAETARAPQELLESLEQLAFALRKQQQYEEAFRLTDSASVLREKLFSAQRSTQLAEEQFILEKKRTSEELSALQREKEITSLQQKTLGGAAVFLGIIVLVLVNRYRLKRRSEEALREINTRLEHANEELTVLNAEKNEFLGIAAHDLKNPLANIRLLSELIRRAALQEPTSNTASKLASEKVLKIHDYNNAILKSTDGMLDLIKNLLDINALEQGGIRLRQETTDIIPLLETTLQNYEARASAKSITLHRDFTASAVLLIIDKQAMMQVLENLVSNAVKYTPLGGIIRLSVSQTEYSCRIAIANTGAGISEAEQKKLFGKFARLSPRPTGGETSNGLGLSIVKKMVEQMQGSVWCESEVGKGATFTVEFGLARMERCL